MQKVGFFRSIHVKFVTIYLLLIMIAMQIIGVYFVGKLENQLVTNFHNAIEDRLPLLEYNIGEEMIKDRAAEDMPPLEEDVRKLLLDFSATDISEVQIINNRSLIIGTSEPSNQWIIGQKTTDLMVKWTLEFGEKIR